MPRHLRHALLLVLLSMPVLWPASQAVAQLSTIDDAQLIDGLKREGMSDLLERYIETNQSQNPVIAKQVEITLRYIEYKQMVDRLAESPDPQTEQAAIAALMEAVEKSRELVREHRDHEQRAVFQTELAELLLFEVLPFIHQQADAFYEFGVPTADQKQAYEQFVVEALENLEEADLLFFRQQGELPKQPDHIEKRVNTLIWQRMINEFYDVRTKYALAHTAYFAAMLPDSHPYFQNLGKNKAVARQKTTIDGERKRLLSLGRAQAEELLSNTPSRWRSLKPRLESVRGRIVSTQGDQEEARSYLKEALDETDEQYQLLTLLSRIASAYTYSREKAFGEAERELGLLSKHPIYDAGGGPLTRLLVVDAHHRILLAKANTQTGDAQRKTIEQAYGVYLDFLNDPSIRSMAAAVRGYIQQRWAATLDSDADIAKAPPVVASAIGELRFIEGKNLMLQLDGKANELAQEKQAVTNPSAREKETWAEAQRAIDNGRRDALKKLNSSVSILTNLLKRESLPDAVTASAMYFRAFSQFYLDRSSADGMLEAAKGMIAVADQFPDQQIGSEAAVVGTDIFVWMMQQPNPGARVEQAYGEAVEVLIDKYPTLDSTNNQRLMYAVVFLTPRGESEHAAEVLGGVPREHRDYFLAQRLRLYELYKKYRSLEGDAAATAAKELAAEAERVRSESDEDVLVVPQDRRAEVLAAAGHARLILSDIAADQGDPNAAEQLLRGFEQTYAGDTELIEEALARRIDYLARAEKYDDSAAEAKKMITDAKYARNAPGVIERVVTRMDELARYYRLEAEKPIAARLKEALNKKEAAVTRLAVDLATLLVEQSGADGERLASYKLILGRALRNSNRLNESEKVLDDIVSKYKQNAQFLFELAETRFAIGGGFRGRVGNEAKIREAAKHYHVLINSLRNPGEGGYPPIYWASWLRWLQICDLLDENTNDIGLTIRQLEQGNSNLGGEPWKSGFDRLREKYPVR